MATRYLHTMLRITDPARSRAFYEALGYEFRRESPIVRNGEKEATLYFYGFPDQEEELELTHNEDGRSYELGTRVRTHRDRRRRPRRHARAAGRAGHRARARPVPGARRRLVALLRAGPGRLPDRDHRRLRRGDATVIPGERTLAQVRVQPRAAGASEALDDKGGSSVRCVGRAGTHGTQPLDHVLLAIPASSRRVQCRSLRVVRNPGEIGSCAQQALRSAALARCAGMPERLRDLPRVGRQLQEILLSIQHAEGGGMPEPVYTGTARDQEASHVPTAVADRVVEWRADRPVRRFEIGAPFDECECDIYVVAARGPMKWRLAMFVVDAFGVRTRAGLDEQRNDGRPVGKYPGQSLTTWSVVRPPTTLSRDPASSGSASSNAAKTGRSPLRMAATAVRASPSSITTPSVSPLDRQDVPAVQGAYVVGRR